MVLPFNFSKPTVHVAGTASNVSPLTVMVVLSWAFENKENISDRKNREID
jgi:hypothetical protein